MLAESGPDTIWHELCHAVWHQNPHVRDMLGSVPEDIDLEMDHTATSRSRRSEHFAQVCERGSGLPADRTHVERSKASAPFEWNDTHLTRRDFSMWDQGAHRMVLQASGSLWAAGCWPSEAGRVMFSYDGTLWTADSESRPATFTL